MVSRKASFSRRRWLTRHRRGYDYAMTPLKNSTGLVAKLFMNTLPQHSQANSIYTQYPFHVPSKSFK